MSDLQNDTDVIEERQGYTDEDVTDDSRMAAPLRDQIVMSLKKRLDDEEIAQKLTNIWTQAMNDRARWIKRQQEFLQVVDEFVDPVYDVAMDWGSNLHLPVTLTVLKSVHSRFYAALMGTKPSFTMRARRGSMVERAITTQRLMEYGIREWSNEGTGIEDEVDKWIWSWGQTGEGILKSSWKRRFSKFEDVETQVEESIETQVDPESGEIIQVPVSRKVEVAVEKVEKVVDCPEVSCVPVENYVAVGGDGCPQRADYVFEEVDYLTASDILSLVDQQIFDKEAAMEIIEHGRRALGSAAGDEMKFARKATSGEDTLEKHYEPDKYRIIEAYIRHPVDDSGINSDIVVWFSPNSDKVLRATYLRRLTKTNLRPYARIEYYKRAGTQHPAGIPELMYSLQKEIDAIHNIRMDVGILQSMPFGFYKPSASMTDEKMPVEPGAMIPLMDPSRDVFFPNIGNKVSFGFQEEASLTSYVEKLMSINDMSLGVMSGAQGATRTATGAQLLAGESSTNLDIHLQRLNRGWKHFLMYFWGLIQERIPDGFEFRVFGQSGATEYLQIRNREAVAGEYDFELEPNSANSNPQLMRSQAQQIYQMTQNPIDFQLGLISAKNRYEAVKNLLQATGIRDTSRFITEPDDNFVKMSPQELVDRTLSGVNVPIDPRLDWQGFIAFVQEIMNNDDLLGQFQGEQVVVLQAKANEAQQMLSAMQQAENDAMVTRQAQANTDATFGGDSGVTANVNFNPADGLGGEG